MIITCTNCNKQFKIDNSLIPDEGRDLQCGSCDHVWFYKAEDKSEAPLKLNQNISENKVDTDIEKKDTQSKASRATFGSAKSTGQQGSLGSPKIHRPQGG